MDKPATHVVTVILYKDEKVLACRRASAKDNDAWRFPTGGVEPGENPLNFCQRMIANQLGCALSTTWLLTTLDYDDPECMQHIDCYVSAPAPKSEPTLQESDRVRWVTRNELLDVSWHGASEELARLIGMEWDQIFMDMHL